MRRFAFLLIAITVPTQPAVASNDFNIERLLRLYSQNNAAPVPVVIWMDWGQPHFLLYADGTLIVPNQAARSRLVSARLSENALQGIYTKLLAEDGFWLLNSNYEISGWSDQPSNNVRVRIPGRKTQNVTVYGNFNPERQPFAPAPPGFKHFIDTLTALIPGGMKPWDPGYVEIFWSDYSYALDPSLPWPKGWPGFDSPLVRPNHRDNPIEKFMIFPSSRLTELDAFLARRPTRGAVVIDGRKMSAEYRWPLPGEKKWSSWTE